MTIVRLAKSIRWNHTTKVVMHRLGKQLIVLFLAVFVTAGMGMSAVQASTMNLKMMNMALDMSMSGSNNCHDCGNQGDAKGVAACVAPACVAPLASLAASTADQNIELKSAHHPLQDLALIGTGSEPSPYPPRTSHIG